MFLFFALGSLLPAFSLSSLLLFPRAFRLDFDDCPALCYADLTSAGSPDPVTPSIRFTSARTGLPSRAFWFDGLQTRGVC